MASSRGTAAPSAAAAKVVGAVPGNVPHEPARVARAGEAAAGGLEPARGSGRGRASAAVGRAVTGDVPSAAARVAHPALLSVRACVGVESVYR
jgi:hypothetical protein